MSHTPKAVFQLDKKRTLILDLEALERFEEATGKSLFYDDILTNISVATLKMLLWAGLVHEDPELTPEQVSKFVHMGNFRQVIKGVTEVWGDSMPEIEGEPGPNPTKKNLPRKK